MNRALLVIGLLFVALVAALFAQTREPAVAGPGGFDLFAFVDGRATSEGEIRTLLVLREAFTARFDGRLEGETLVLEERFAFPDGERLQVWRLALTPGGYRGTVETERADGALAPSVPVVGVADATGVALDYRGIAPGGGRTLHFRHHMRLRSDGTVANHVVVSLFGLPLAVSDVTFTRAALPSPSGER